MSSSNAAKVGIARDLLADGGWEERVIAWEVIASHPTAADAIDDRLVEKLASGLSDWAAVDHFGVTVLGRAWRDGSVSDVKIDELIHSPDRWRRRLALVATVPLNLTARGGKGDARRTLRVCRQLLSDRDDMVVKALSWADRRETRLASSEGVGLRRVHIRLDRSNRGALSSRRWWRGAGTRSAARPAWCLVRDSTSRPLVALVTPPRAGADSTRVCHPLGVPSSVTPRRTQ